jgi:hypothetical protein
MALTFPTIFRANVQLASAQNFSVANGAIGIGLSDLQMASVGANNLAVSTKAVIGGVAPDGANHLHVVGTVGATGNVVAGTRAAVGGATDAVNHLQVTGTAGVTVDVTIGANLDVGVDLVVSQDAMIGDFLAVNAASVDGSNELHVTGAAGIEQHVLVGNLLAANVVAAADGDIALSGKLMVGASFNAANVGGANDMYVQGDATIATDLHIGGDLYLTGGIQIPQLQSEIVTLDNVANHDTAGTAIAMTGSSVPNAGMLLMLVASNDRDQSAPSAAFIAAKPQDGTAAIITTLHSGASIVNGGSGVMQLEMVWNAGNVKPALHYTAHAGTTNDGQVNYGITTLISAGPSPT